MMKSRFLFLPCLLLAAAGSNAQSTADTKSKDPVLKSFKPLEAVRGTPIEIVGENLKGKTVTITLKRADALPKQDDKVIRIDDKACPQEPLASTVTASDDSFVTFVIDQDTCLGNYTVTATLGTQGGNPADSATKSESPLPGTLHIVPKDLKLTAVHPSVPYPKEVGSKESVFNLVVIGDGFSHRKEENALVFETRPSPILCPAEKCTKNFNSFVTNNGHELHFEGLPTADFHGPLKVRVRVGDQTSKETLDVTLSQVSERTPLAVALLFTGLLCVLIYFILKSGVTPVDIAKRKYFLGALFLDKETNTYSLSKLQFYLWTGAAVIGYAYLTAARSMIQGNFEFADIPSGLPGILLASAGTSVLALGITSSKGNKGAGDVHPGLADFITSGGVIAADRLQFLVWTLVGVCSFLMLVFLRDPGTIQDLPKIPDGFLELMGISSAGYLGGKLGRKQGPRIEIISAATGSLKLTISGAGLSQFGAFRIDDTLVKKENIATADHLPKIITPDTTNNEQGYARTLELEINDPDPAWFSTSKEHKLTISNPDSQRADGTYTVAAAPSITSVSYPALNGGVITIAGDNFHPKFSASYTVADGPEEKVDPDKVTFTDSKNVQVTISDVPKLLKLKIVNPDGQSAFAPVPSIAKAEVTPNRGAIAVTGSNFHPKVAASYTIGDDPNVVQLPGITFTDSQNIQVPVAGVAAGQAITLKVANPDGGSASTKVQM